MRSSLVPLRCHPICSGCARRLFLAPFRLDFVRKVLLRVGKPSVVKPAEKVRSLLTLKKDHDPS